VTAHLPLGDIRVLDLTVARAGPTCVRQLADWGADVIRVEPPPDPARPGQAAEGRHGCDFQHLHRNKRSLSLNLKAPGARDVLMRLVDTADVLIENMRPPVKERLGFGFSAVHARTATSTSRARAGGCWTACARRSACPVSPATRASARPPGARRTGPSSTR
jgi:crotonobetainyl-CoA:carnitine CoA-transferase CaiB-like acyl-CoA transferase